MAKRGFLVRHGIVRNAIKKDLLYFALPWIVALCAGMIFSASDLVRQQGSQYVFSRLSIVGIALFVIGFTIILVAHITLWRLYSSALVIKKDHRLLTHGIYRSTRHPIYLGTIIATIGLSVYASSLYGFIAMLAQFPIFLIRIRIEERLLTEEFGDEHRAYKMAVSKLIPFIY